MSNSVMSSEQNHGTKNNKVCVNHNALFSDPPNING
jgi:hypothetical protein